MKKLDFSPNLRNRYSIRRFTVGTASILIGSLLFLGHNGEIKAAENTNDNTVIKVSKDTSHPQQEVVENAVLQEKTTDTPQQANDSQTTQNELEDVKTEAVSKLSKSTYLTEGTRKQYTTEAKQAQSKADVPAVVDSAKKSENELVKQAEQEKAADTTTAQTKAVAEKSVPKNETVKKESKTELSSVKTSETPKTSEAETVATPNNATPAIDAVLLTTKQKVDEVKKEFSPNYDSSKIDAALAVIDTNDLSASQIKAEVLKLLIDQSSAQKDLYTPQATLVRKKRDTQETAVRPFQVDTSTKDEVVVTKDNFKDYFLTVGDATYNPVTGIATLTPNEKSKKGAISLDTKLNINKDFHFSGAINLGDKGEGHEKDGVPGGDGIGFMFNPGKVHQLGLYGAGLGFGGLPYTFGFKFDTFVNNGYDRNGKAQSDPQLFNGKGSFGAFVYANAEGKVLTQVGDGTFKAALLNHQPHDNQFIDLTIDYRADTQVMTINYGGQVWSQKMNTYFNYTKKKDFALSICASTGGAYNLQQVRIDRFTYTASALLEEDFVDEATQELIDTPTRISGDLDNVIKIEDPTSKLESKGYKIISKDTALAPDYDSEDNTVTLTNDTQFIVYKLKDVQPPIIGSISNITSDVDKPINPVKLNISDNSGKLYAKTVTGLPEGLIFNETTNEITGIPTKVGSTTVTVTVTDFSKLRTTKTFIYTVADTVAPVITAVETKKTEIYAPITPITVEAEDNSKVAPILTVTGLPAGLTFNSITNQITGKPTAKGTSTVTIKATDASNNVSTSTFDIMVQTNKALETLKTVAAEAKSMTKDSFTPNSVKNLDSKVAEAEVLIAHPENGSTDVFNVKTQAIKQAKDQLIYKANKDKLEKVIVEAGNLGQLNTDDTEDKAVRDKLAVANAVKADDNATKEQVDTATTKLSEVIAQKRYKDALDRLNTAIADANSVNQAEYTPKTVTPFNTVLTAGETTATDKSMRPEQLDAATQAIIDAKELLQHKADKSSLEAEINKTKALGVLSAVDKEDKVVQDALTAGEGVKDNPNASQQEVQNATQSLNDAVANKKHADALDALKSKLAEVKALDKTPLTPASVNTLNGQVTAGDAVVANERTKTTEAIKAAIKAITDAQNALVNQADKTELDKAIIKEGNLGPLDVGDTEDKAVQNALATANQVKDDGNATPQQVTVATEALNHAIEVKEHQDALDKLNAVIQDAAAVAKENYTPETVTPFDIAITEGKAKAANANTTPEQLKAAAQVIKDAKNTLKQKANKEALNQSVSIAEALQPFKDGDPEDDGVKTALAKAKQVQTNPNVDQTVVDESKVQLDQAVKVKQTQDAADALKQAALDELKAELAKVAKIDRNNFTPNSIQPLTEKERNGNALVANPNNQTVDEIKVATEALKEVQKGLQAKADKARLQAAIAKAEALTGLNPTDKEDGAVQDALTAAKVVKENPNATQQEVQKATQVLNEAMTAKAHADALDTLKAELAKVANLNKEQYTPKSVMPLNSKEADGKAIVAVPNSKTTDEIKTATQLLKDAEAGLVDRADKAVLQAAIEKATALPNLNPSDKEDKVLQNALATAQTVKDNADAIPQEVQKATERLNNAVAMKIRQDALDELQKALDAAKVVDKNNYKPNTVTPFEAAITAGENAKVDTNKTPDELKAAAQSIKDTQTALAKKANKDDLNTSIQQAEGLGNLDPADVEDKAVQVALTKAKTIKADPNVEQAAVDAAKGNLDKAIKAKQDQDAKEHQDALDELQKALADAAQVNKNQYKPNSVAPFEAAVNNGTAAKNDTAKTTKELKEATKAINNAKNALHEKANKEGLDNSVTAAGTLQPLKEGDAEDAAVKAALEKAKAVQADQNTDQATVDSAKTELDNAVNAKKAADAKEAQDAAAAKQAALDALKAELAKVGQIEKYHFTPNTTEPLTEKENAGKAIVAAPDAKTTDDIKTATQELKDAQKNLVQKADKTALEAALDKVAGFNRLDKTDVEDKAVDDALVAGQEVEGDLNANPEAVKRAVDNLNKAISAKERQDALDELTKSLDAAKAVTKDDYKPNTVTPLETAIIAGETAKADRTQTPEQLKAATKAIKDAQQALQAKANKADLNTSIQIADDLGQLDPTDAEAKAVQDVLTKAKAVQADQNANQAAVDAVKAELDNALTIKKAQDAAAAKQAALDALKAELAKVKTLDKDTFTPSTVTPLNKKETAGQAIVDAPDTKTPDEIKEVTQALKDAEAVLVKRTDKGDLEKAIEKANALGQLEPTDAEDKVLKDALQAGQVVDGDENATPQQVADATKAINNALVAKEHQDALDELNKVIDKAQKVEQADYTPESVKPLDTAKKAGQTLATDKAATTEQLKAATKLINEAINQLVVDKTELAKQIEAAKAFELLNASATDQLLKHALDAAIGVQNNPNAIPQEVKEATWNLEDEIGNKIASDAIEALRDAINKSTTLKAEDYTPNSYVPLKTATSEGQSILDDPSSANLATTNAKTKEIKQLIDTLKEKADKTSLEAALDKAVALNHLDDNNAADKAVALNHLDDNNAADKAVHDALLAGQEVGGDLNATPEEVKKATDDLNNALAEKERQDAVDELQKALDSAKAVNKEDYKPNTVTPLETAITAGEAVKADATKTPEDLKAAIKAVQDAQKALEVKANKTDLNTSIQTAESLGQLDPTDAEDEAVKTALTKAKAVQADQNTNQATVDVAKTELDNAVNAKKAADAKKAQAKADALKELQVELEKVKVLDKNAYTPNTVTPLTEKEEASQAIVDAPDAKIIDEIKAATQALKDAEKALQPKADKTALEAALDKAVIFNHLDNNDAEDKAVHKALLAGQEVEGDLNATPEEVKKATDDLNNALVVKERQDALDELNKALDVAKAVHKADYTPNTVTPLEIAITAGEAVKADATKTPEELKAAVKAINDAKTALQEKANKNDLNASVQTAESLGQLDPTDAEDEAVKTALTKAKAVQADQNTNQATVDVAKTELDNAVNIKKASDAKEAQALKAAEEAKQAALDALKAGLEKAKLVNKSDYTPNSVKPLAEAETTGQTVVDNASGQTIKEIEAATQDLKDAQNKLVEKANKVTLEKAIETAENINTIDPSDKEDVSVLEALSNAKEVQADSNASQADVDAASKALKDAVKAKQVQDAKEAKQAALDVLKAELEKAKAVHKSDYTPNSVKPLAEAVTTGQAIVENTDDVSTDDIQDATKAIQTSLNALKVVQTSTSDNTIDKDQPLSSQSVTNTSDKAIQKLESLKAQSKQTTKSNKVLPNTGQEVPVDPKYASLIFALGGLMTLFSRRKKEENTEK